VPPPGLKSSFYLLRMAATASNPRRLLFVYGSLLQPTGIAAVDQALARWCRPLGEASVSGKLYSLGAYPGVKPAPARGPRVKGRLLFLKDPDKALCAFDRYEDFHPRAPRKSEFVRALAPVTVQAGGRTILVTGQIYYYNRSVRGRRPIEAGDFLAYRKARGISSDGLRKRGGTR
jgi:gamma-glutamylcyclotransferase (GGCT)/AIG2-like uncharacterized protein YtfP